MNKIYKMFALAGMVTMLGACNVDPEYYELPDQPDEMHVAAQLGINSEADKNLINLSGTYSDENAVVLSWSPIKDNNPVKYLVRFMATESKNDNYTPYYCDRATCTSNGCPYNHDGHFGTDANGNITFSITHNQLNTVIARWAFPGDEISVTAQVVGTINNEQTYIKPQNSTVAFNAVGWEKYPVSLIAYITDAKGKKSTVELTQPTLGTGVYTGDITVTSGTVFFQKPVTSKQAASYYMGEDGKLKYVEEDVPNAPVREDLQQFTITQAGTLMVDVNDDYLDVQILNIQMPAGATPCMVGDGTEVGWVENSPAGLFKMSENPRTPYIYSWTGMFYAPNEFPGLEEGKSSEGTFKILLEGKYENNCFFAPEANANPAENHTLRPARLQNDGGDNKWLVPETGKYTFTINAMEMTTSFEKAN